MRKPLDIAFFGSSLVSAYRNGAATYFRGLVRALAARGHRVTFYEPDVFDRQKRRDMADPPWARVVVYPVENADGALEAVESARNADILVKASCVGVFDELLETAVLDVAARHTTVVFWDVDASSTLTRIHLDRADPLRTSIPHYDYVLTYGGGDVVVDAYRELGARRCVPIYHALDPDIHYRVVSEPRFTCDLAFHGNRLPDREAAVDELFFGAASALPDRSFLLAGDGWGSRAMPLNVGNLGRLAPADYNALNSSARAILTVARDGSAPASSVFEAAGAGACLLADAWAGIDAFLEPGREVLIAEDGSEVASIVAALDDAGARLVGEAARRRVLADHTYASRAAELETLLAPGRISL